MTLFLWGGCSDPWEIIEHDLSFIPENIRVARLLIAPVNEVVSDEPLPSDVYELVNETFFEMFAKVHRPSDLTALETPCPSVFDPGFIEQYTIRERTRYLICPVALNISGVEPSKTFRLQVRIWDIQLKKIVWESFAYATHTELEAGIYQACGQFIRSLPGTMAPGRPGAILE
ncbi:MAG: hypothetical protein D6675_03520 [Gemmatimonadetes bacterium]|nr:MAG: hypothetical protein D6675_03520 [Gemmatimonadota bacterium]